MFSVIKKWSDRRTKATNVRYVSCPYNRRSVNEWNELLRKVMRLMLIPDALDRSKATEPCVCRLQAGSLVTRPAIGGALVNRASRSWHGQTLALTASFQSSNIEFPAPLFRVADNLHTSSPPQIRLHLALCSRRSITHEVKNEVMKRIIVVCSFSVRSNPND